MNTDFVGVQRGFLLPKMKESENTYLNSRTLWENVAKSAPGVLVLHEKEIFEPNLDVCVVFCPLYAHGELSDSKIIFPPSTIDDSRVAGKFTAYLPTISSMHKYLKDFGGGVHLTAVFANKGVILSEKPMSEHNEALAYHKELYYEASLKLSQILDMPVTFYSYDDLGINFPQFYNPKEAQLPENIRIDSNSNPETQIISALNQYFNFLVPIINNKTSRKVVKSVLQMKNTTLEAAFWLIAGYLAFDPMIPEIIGEKGVYVVSERADSLFWISKLTPKLDSLTRVQIKVT